MVESFDSTFGKIPTTEYFKTEDKRTYEVTMKSIEFAYKTFDEAEGPKPVVQIDFTTIDGKPNTKKYESGSKGLAELVNSYLKNGMAYKWIFSFTRTGTGKATKYQMIPLRPIPSEVNTDVQIIKVGDDISANV